MICTKKNCSGQLGYFGPFWAHSDNSGSALRILSKFCRMKWCIKYMKIWLFFWEKKIIWGNLIFLTFRPFFTVWLDMAKIEPGHCYYWILKQDMITFMITTGSLNSQDMISILKQSRQDFSGKYLCNGYCMDIMWFLCVEVKIHGLVKLL